MQRVVEQRRKIFARVGIGERRGIVHRVTRHLDVVAHVPERRVDLVHEARDHLAERGHLLGLHELQLRSLEPRVRALELGAVARQLVLDRAQDVEHGADAKIMAVAARDDEILGDRVPDVRRDRARRLVDRRVYAEHERPPAHHCADRTAAVELATVRHQVDPHQFGTADRADRQSARDDRQRKEPCVRGIENALADIEHMHIRSDRGSRLHKVREIGRAGRCRSGVRARCRLGNRVHRIRAMRVRPANAGGGSERGKLMRTCDSRVTRCRAIFTRSSSQAIVAAIRYRHSGESRNALASLYNTSERAKWIPAFAGMTGELADFR